MASVAGVRLNMDPHWKWTRGSIFHRILPMEYGPPYWKCNPPNHNTNPNPKPNPDPNPNPNLNPRPNPKTVGIEGGPYSPIEYGPPVHIQVGPYSIWHRHGVKPPLTHSLTHSLTSQSDIVYRSELCCHSLSNKTLSIYKCLSEATFKSDWCP